MNFIKKFIKWFLKKEEFKYECGCHHKGLFGCPARSLGGLICTNKVGHKGDHVACGTRHHRLEVWRQK